MLNNKDTISINTYSRQRKLSAKFHFLIINMLIKWQARTTKKMKPKPNKTTRQSKING